ncbi:MAG: T9SS type A sorting domain-containing protein [Flavobacteriales bacterium]|nr:T9SS type A sorting domain-containing protein [Flavobacteriales bacterium]
MKNLLTLAIFSFISVLVNSQEQNFQCPTVDYEENPTLKLFSCEKSSIEYANLYSKYNYYSTIYNNRNEVVIYMDVHIWQKDNGSANYSDTPLHRARIQQTFDIFNQIYNSNQAPSDPIVGVIDYTTTKIKIVLNDVYFNQSTVCWGKGGTASEVDGEFLNNEADILYPTGKKNLKWHITGVNPNNNVKGYARFPLENVSFLQHYIVSYNRDNDIVYPDSHGLWNWALHLAHEMGHNFDLQHTYAGGAVCNQSVSDYLDDVFGSGTSAICPHDGSFSCDFNSPSNSCTNNLMGGTNDNRYYSPKQVQRIHRALSLKSIRNYAVAYNFDPNKFIDITQNETWDFRIKMYNNLRIKTGSTLTIKCTVEFVPEAKIIIEPGARLILDGGVLTNEYYYNTFWQGIEVWGTTSQHQYPLSQPLHQGKLEIKNGGIIENALIGVRNWKTNDYSKIGGVIIANDGVFKNNKKAVEFVIYENFSQTNPAVKMNNLSRFTNTDFIIDNDYLDDPTYFQYHVTMWGVYGISYSNCHFFNNVSPKSYLANRNRAIYSIDAGYSINAGCSILVPNGSTCPESNLLKSTFTGFDKTIEATGAGTTKTVSVSQAIFDNNVNGVFFSELDNFSVNRSIMTLGNPSYSTSPSAYFGINTTNSTGYQIEENQFSKYTGINGTYGVSIANSGVENNRVYKNKFTGLTFGQALNGVNRNSADPLKGFQFLCNEFNGNTSRAVSVLVNNSTNGIRLYQGEFSPLKSAGNTFLNTPSNAFTIYNGTPNGIIYYHNNGTTIPTNNTANVSLVATTVSNTCPSSFSIISGKQALQNHSDSLQVIYSDLKYNYLSLIDDGNTASFIDNIQNDWSETAWKLRNELIAKSPFVSEKSLLESVKQNILPNAMILEICLANPDVTKNQRFIEQLNSIYTLPEYMLNYILENDEKTIRTTLEAQIGTISSEKSVIEDELIRLQATADERTIEDISNVYSLKTNSQKKIDLIELAIETENWQQASSILNESLLDENLKDEHYRFNNYGDYIAFRSNLEGRKLSQLEPTEIQYLEDLALFENKVGGYARNILCFFYERCYENNNVDDSDKMLLIQTKPDKTLSELFYNIEIYPNPAAEYCSMKWEILDELKECTYVVYSIDGIEILRKGITSNQGEELIDTRNYKNGTYLIVIENNGIKKQIEKFIVSNK